MPKSNAQPILTDAIVKHQLDVFRAETAMIQDASKVLKSLERSLTSLVVELNPTGQRNIKSIRKAKQEFLKSASSIIEDKFLEVSSTISANLLDLAEVEAVFITAAVNKALGKDVVNLPNPEDIENIARSSVLGFSMSDWFADNQNKYQANFINIMQGAFLEGLSDAEIVKRIRSENITTQSQSKIRTLVRTSSASITANIDRHVYASNSNIFKGIQQISVFDSRTSTVCQAYAGKVWDLDFKPVNHKLPYKGGVPRHPNCRSRERGVMKEEYGVPEKDLSFDGYLKRISRKEQNNILGETKAEYWRQGKLSPKQLVDSISGNALKVPDLLKKVDPKYSRNHKAFLDAGHPEETAHVRAKAWAKYANMPYGEFESVTAKIFGKSSRIRTDEIGQGLVSVENRMSDKFDIVRRKFNLSEQSVYHDYLVVKDEFQGQGLTRKLFRDSLPLYEKLGIERIDVYAALDRGAYAWARYGFVPKQKDWKHLSSDIRSRLDSIKGSIDKYAYDSIRNWTLSSDPKKIWNIVDLKYAYDGDKIGKHLLHELDWAGSLNLTDPTVVKRLKGYVERK